MSEPIVLPANVYDTLEFSTLVYGGIGGGWYTTSRRGDLSGKPLCFLGHADGAGVAGDSLTELYGINALISDGIVARVNERKGKDKHDRITWDEFVREGNIQRGAA
jgi:hypothetical protein